jgi:hypothetical protein
MLNIEKIKSYIQSANINFLFGSGLSRPYLITLGDIEKWLTDLNTLSDENQRIIIQASIYRKYFNGVIYPNTLDAIELDRIIDGNYDYVYKNYSTFLTCWNEIIARRSSNLLNKQINIYTTNIDLLVESAAETSRIEFNDGFRGIMNPVFDEGNFQKSYSKTSAHFQHTSEIPVFNLLKLHGSINWVTSDENEIEIKCDTRLDVICAAKKELDKINSKYFVEIESGESGDTIDSLKVKANDVVKEVGFKPEIYEGFNAQYQKIIMVNPTKQKFKETVLDLHFYELMRLYSNALEKENSILFVQGFSFADEHISKITLRAAETNPTLLIIVFSYNDDQKTVFEKNLKIDKGGPKNNNIWIVTPTDFINENSKGKDESIKKDLESKFKSFDFRTINELYKRIGDLIPLRNYGK